MSGEVMINQLKSAGSVVDSTTSDILGGDNSTSNHISDLNGSNYSNGSMGNGSSYHQDQLFPPPIPHIESNSTPLSVIIKRQAVFTYKQFREFISTLNNSSLSDFDKKRKFLNLIILLRENFLRLYVLIKWSKNSKKIEKLIDLFVWLREKNQLITNNLVSISSIKESLVRAKLPNPDISTSLEVLLLGKPQLNDFNLLPEKPLNPRLIYSTLKNLNVELSIRMALQIDLPQQFYNYEIKNGRVIFDVFNSFQASISIADDNNCLLMNAYNENNENYNNEDLATAFKNKFLLVDYRLKFKSVNNLLLPAIVSLPPKTQIKLENQSNLIISKDGLNGLYNLLHRYATTCKLYLLHRHLINLRMGIWKSHLTHVYNAEKCYIVITYWLKRKSVKSTIEIGILNSNDELSFKWYKEGRLSNTDGINLINSDDGIINIELLINKIIKRHIDSIMNNIQNDLFDKIEGAERFSTIYHEEDNTTKNEKDDSLININNETKQKNYYNNNSTDFAETSSNSNNSNITLIFNTSANKTVKFGIDKLSGEVYFQNPTPLINVISLQMNYDHKNIAIKLLMLRLETQLSELSAMLLATGWIKVDVVKLTNNEVLKLGINDKQLKAKNLINQLISLQFYRRREWPANWFLTCCVPGFSSNVQWWMTKIKSSAGQWSINSFEPINLKPNNNNNNNNNNIKNISNNSTGGKDSSPNSFLSSNSSSNDSDTNYDYSSLLNLVKFSTSKLIRNWTVEELEIRGAKLKVVDFFNNNNTENTLNIGNKNDQINGYANGTTVSTTETTNVSRNSNFLKFVNKELKVDLNNQLIIINNKSLYNIPNCRDSIILSLAISNDNIESLITGKLNDEFNMKMTFDDKSVSIELDPLSSVFKLKSKTNLKEIFKNSQDTNNSITLPGAYASKSIANGGGGALGAATSSILKQTNGNKILGPSLEALVKFSRMLTLLQLISNEKLIKVIGVSLNKISFKYGSNTNEFISLILKSNEYNNKSESTNTESSEKNSVPIIIELPKDNPHKYAINYLNYLISLTFESHSSSDIDDLQNKNELIEINMNNYVKGSLSSFIKYLKISLPLYKLFAYLIEDSESAKAEFFTSNGFDDSKKSINAIPRFVFDVNDYENDQIVIDYYKLIEKSNDDVPLASQQDSSGATTKKNKKLANKNNSNKFERQKLSVVIKLKHKGRKISTKNSVYLITFEKSSNIHILPTFIEDIITGNNKTNSSKLMNNKSIDYVPLTTGLSCDYKNLFPVLKILHTELKDSFQN
ncbi:hypothetical protein B5S30_g3732 [[Candida] boidinii]|nr:hypothetical protein B5S30_g3732 [[Candida] boidinii]